MTEHMKYGGSTIERVELCPGSVKAVMAVGEVSPGPAAERGTRIHARIEQLWKNPGDSSALANDKEECIAIAVYARLLELAEEHGFQPSDFEMEKHVTLHEIHNEAGGTVDHIAFRCFGDLLIADTKTGYNYVAAEENLQMLFYACGYIQGLDPFTRAVIKAENTKIHLVILQPEQEAPFTVNVRKWFLAANELEKYAQRFHNAIVRAEDQPDLLIPGEHCETKYCNARSTCPAYKKYLNERSLGAFDDLLTGRDVIVPRGRALSAMGKAVKSIKKFCEAVLDDIKSELMKDKESVPDWTLEDSYGNRTWVDIKRLDALAKTNGIKPAEYKPPGLVSPAQFEKLLKSKGIKDVSLDELTERPYIGVKIAEIKDVAASLEQTFSNLETVETNKRK